MDVPDNLLYTKTHEWARRESDEVSVGITAHAQDELRDVVFVELPKVGKLVQSKEAVCVIESVKAAFDIYAPISGTISRVNDKLAKSPGLINQDCYGEGWLFAIRANSADELAVLLSAQDYSKQLEMRAH